MAFVVLPTKAKNDPLGFQHANNIKTDLDYLKIQTEVLVAADATVPLANVIPEATLKVANDPVDGTTLIARAAETGGWKWESLYENDDFWAFQ